jgi:hypothetical protein
MHLQDSFPQKMLQHRGGLQYLCPLNVFDLRGGNGLGKRGGPMRQSKPIPATTETLKDLLHLAPLAGPRC